LAINKFSSGALHGSLSQGIRDRIMDQFRQGHISILIATDLAARGIDVAAISYVVNYHFNLHQLILVILYGLWI
jgi:ATP-dependent RNA helicase DeaD